MWVGVKTTKVKCIYRPQSVRNEICLRDFNTLANVLPLSESVCVGIGVSVCVGICVYGKDWHKKSMNSFGELKN